MPKRHINIISTAQDKQCSHIACNDCSIFGLCHTVGGDVDLSLLDTLVKNRRTFKRG